MKNTFRRKQKSLQHFIPFLFTFTPLLLYSQIWMQEKKSEMQFQCHHIVIRQRLHIYNQHFSWQRQKNTTNWTKDKIIQVHKSVWHHGDHLFQMTVSYVLVSNEKIIMTITLWKHSLPPTIGLTLFSSTLSEVPWVSKGNHHPEASDN